jgi:hypothetical protein
VADLVTFADLQALLTTLLDDTSTDLVTSNDRLRAINGAYYELYDWASRLSDGQGLEAAQANLSLVAGTATAALPTDCFRVIGIYYKEDEDNSYPWIPVTPINQHWYRQRISRSAKRLAYYIRGSNIVIVPTPDYADTTHVFIEYIPDAVNMTADSDTPAGIPKMYRELIGIEAFVRLKEKEGSEPGSAIWEKRKELRAAFERGMEQRQMQSSRRLGGDPGFDDYEGSV